MKFSASGGLPKLLPQRAETDDLLNQFPVESSLPWGGAEHLLLLVDLCQEQLFRDYSKPKDKRGSWRLAEMNS